MQRIYSRKNRELFLLALRVLTRFNHGETLSRRNVIILRRNADADDKQLPVDELCCSIIQRELGGLEIGTEAA